MTQTKKKFSLRALTSVTALMAFAILTITGIVLFIVPPGRIANWTRWTFGGLTKTQWQGLHIVFSVLFLIASVLHVWLNWRPLVSYFQQRIQLKKRFSFRWEWALPIVLCGGVVWGVLAGVKPFSSLIAWQEDIKKGYDETTEEIAVPPHSELLTLVELASEADLDIDAALERLRAREIAFESPDAIVGEVAEANGLSPQALFDIAAGVTTGGQGQGRGRGAGRGGGGEAGEAAGDESHAQGAGEGGGFGRAGGGPGRKTVEEYSAEAGVSTDEAISRLSAAGYKAEPGDMLRDVAGQTGARPVEVLEIIGGAAAQ